AGEQFDRHLGLYYLRARYMNPNTGRFWSMDAFEGNQTDPISLHKYVYATDNPVNIVDPSGHDGSFSLPGQLGVSGVQGIMARVVLPALNRAYFGAINQIIAGIVNPAMVMDYLQLYAGYLTAASLAIEVAASTTRTIIDNVTKNTVEIPSRDVLRGVALENITARRLGRIHLGGSVSVIDMYDANESKMAISVKSYDLSTESPHYERNLVNNVTRDIRELQKLDTIGAAGTTVKGEYFKLNAGEAQVKVFVALVPEDKSLVLTSKNFLIGIRNAAAAVEAGAEESRAILVLPLPVKGWKGNR
ncbi:MAG TPA: RHS repeat-associated core domain-containing protein, partial [Verrucomicrobiae bacterium]|nr:RHS repeat-associated core domain-containing protein [Verrucomicrobiae bacterium]